MNIGFPFRFDSRGRSAVTDDATHIRDLIEQVLFTAPGERVNLPSFGSGLLQLVFAPNSDTMAAAAQFVVTGALQQWLGDLIQAQEVQVEADDSQVSVTVSYVVRRTQQQQVNVFTRGAAS